MELLRVIMAILLRCYRGWKKPFDIVFWLDSGKNFVLNLQQLLFGNSNRQKSNESRQGDAEVSFAQLSLPDSGNKAPSIFVFDEEEKYEQNQQHPHKIFSA